MAEPSEDWEPEVRTTRIIHEHRQRGGSFLGSVLVLIGVLYILRDLGKIPYFTLADLARFWPVLLVLLGLALLRRGIWSVLLELLVVAAVAWLLLSPAGRSVWQSWPNWTGTANAPSGY